MIILGAGASYAAHVQKAPPVMNSFVRRGREIVGVDYSSLWTFLEHIGFSIKNLESGNPNLEELFTILQTISTGIWYTSRRDYVKSVGKEFARTRPVDLLLSFIVEVLDAPSISAISKPCKYHNELFKALHPGDTVISFNYDLIADASLREVVAWSEAGGYGFACQSRIQELDSEGRFDPEKPCDIALLKPHGSLNWTLDTYNDDLSSDSPSHYSYRNRPIRKELLGFWSGEVRFQKKIALRALADIEGHCYKNLPISAFKFDRHILEKMTNDEQQRFLETGVTIHSSTYIIPPAAYKFGDPDIADDIVEIWSHMNKALTSARRVLCVGYSFPSTDVEFCSLFRLALLRNINPDVEVQVVNPDPSVVQRLTFMVPNVRIKHVASSLSEYVRTEQ